MTERNRRTFLRNPTLKLLDIPILAAGNHVGTVSHDALSEAIQAAQLERRVELKSRKFSKNSDDLIVVRQK